MEKIYKELISRNWAFIPENIQNAVQEKRILLVGCGLGCNIARSLAAMGWTKFIVIDGDVVEMSNLNRQAYSIADIGKPKAEATRDIILSVNPYAEVEVVNEYINEISQIKPLIEKSDFILNTVDYHTSVFLTLNDYVQKLEKIVLFPTNIGFGGILMIFDNKSKSMSEYLNLSINEDCNLSSFLKRISLDYLPDNLKNLYIQLMNDTKGELLIPQVMPGAEIVSAMVSTIIIKLLSGDKIETCPNFYVTDAIGGICFGDGSKRMEK